MIRRIFMLVLAAGLLLSCSKSQDVTVPEVVDDPCEVLVNIVGDGMVRSTDNSPDNESRVNHLQVLIFDEEGRICDYKDAGGVISTSVLTSTGKKRIWCLVNFPIADGIDTEDELLSMRMSLSDNRLDGFLMSGFVDANLEDMDVVSVNVKRYVSKVSISRISSSFSSASVAELPMKICGIYMVNVAGDASVGLDGEVNRWVNRLGHADSDHDYLLYDEVSCRLTAEEPYIAEHSFYVFPNRRKDDAGSATWQPLQTILSIEVELDGQRGWYPIVIPDVQRNIHYKIDELIITRRPSPSPYDPVGEGEAVFDVNVTEWGLGLNLGTIVI